MNKKKENYLKYLRWFLNRKLKIERKNSKKKKHHREAQLKTGIKITENYIRIVFPEVIDLYNSKRCEETLGFINQEYNDIDKYKDGVVFNFSKVKKITLSGGIIIRCFYDFLLSKNTKINCNEIMRDKTQQILSHIGILKNKNIQITHKDISRWTIKYWSKTDITKKKFSNELISEIIKTTTGWEDQSKGHRRLYEVVPEILFNCIDHAYNDENRFQLFYLFSGIADKKYVFCVLDRGIGFKATYQKRQEGRLCFENIENDGDYIKYSIQMDHSSMRTSGRGNGLYTLKENILNLRGNIYIHSYNGKVEISPKKGEIQSENRFPLIGSLVQFEIPMLEPST